MTSEQFSGPQDAFFTVFHDLPRQGPGSDAVTLAMIDRLRPLLPADPYCVDMGCGNGRSSLLLAEHLAARVAAVDTHQPFLDELADTARRRGLAERLDIRCRDMLDARLKRRTLDLVWSEGAAYVVGLEAALEHWRLLLKPGGYLVVSDCMWLHPSPPPAVRRFWEAAYPDMRTVAESLAVAERLGYAFLHAETLPECGWWQDYYLPLERRLETLGPMAERDPALAGVMAGVRDEIAMYRAHADVYGYVFMVLRWPGASG
ncbi:SAM-dependent methyltransferase [Novispirillum itersonii]|uniref:Serine/threonine-protein kinase HipA n=1 Tax=Novispirillum itersonii TaxID=189 RepID=A0A7W9ZDD0_NOVIT|nr:class I SAM-dependent methyltransferase [Novispirillum itersonii]MBB6209441.1 serine/threonine-protein kinase HipA [Novispirillum itersonii]